MGKSHQGDLRNDDEPSYMVQSVAKALSILELFDDERIRLTGSEIAELTGMNRATSYRFCQTLTELGYLEQLDGGGYRVGLKALRIAHAAVSGQDLPEIARPILETLREKTGETTNMAVRDHDHIVYVVRLKTQQILNIGLSVGSRLPVHASSLGKAIMAFLPDDELDVLLNELEYRQMTDHTIVNRSDMERELSDICERGYSLNQQELALGLHGIAAPVFSPTRYPLAAVNIAMTRPMLKREINNSLAPALLGATDEISERIEYADLPQH